MRELVALAKENAFVAMGLLIACLYLQGQIVGVADSMRLEVSVLQQEMSVMQREMSVVRQELAVLRQEMSVLWQEMSAFRVEVADRLARIETALEQPTPSMQR